jgi:hypothetical protein
MTTKVSPDLVLQPSFFRKNAIINGAFAVAQRGTSFTSATTPANSDDTYLLDRWTLLSDGNDIVDVTQNTATIPTSGLYSCALDVETANKKFGIIQFIEQKNCHRMLGSTVTLSFKARKGGSNATVGTMRAAVLAWDGTADTLTSDVVSAWNASGTNPTLVANWTAENVAADLTLTTSFQTFSITGISIDTASAKNLAVFLYYNNADGTVGDFIYVTDVQLEPGSVATEFEHRWFQDELLLCQRYCPAISLTSGDRLPATGNFADTNTAYLTYIFPVQTRVPPTSLTVTTVGNLSVGVDGLVVLSALSSFSILIQISVNACRVQAVASTTTFAAGQFATLDATGDTIVFFNGCEL